MRVAGGTDPNALKANPLRYRGYIYDTETGFYYLQSRYYDPTVGRFINADGYVNANGDLVGFNMFAYCSNNPVMGSDPTGKWTLSLNLSAMCVFIAGGYIGISVSIDDNWNIALQKSKADGMRSCSGTVLGGFAASVGCGLTFTVCDTVDDLCGWFNSIGGSIECLSAEAVFDESFSPVGGTLSAGAGGSVGPDIHCIISNTTTIGSFNVKDWFLEQWDKVVGWFS